MIPKQTPHPDKTVCTIEIDPLSFILYRSNQEHLDIIEKNLQLIEKKKRQHMRSEQRNKEAKQLDKTISPPTIQAHFYKTRQEFLGPSIRLNTNIESPKDATSIPTTRSGITHSRIVDTSQNSRKQLQKKNFDLKCINVDSK